MKTKPVVSTANLKGNDRCNTLEDKDRGVVSTLNLKDSDRNGHILNVVINVHSH